MSLLNVVHNEINTGWTKQIDQASFDMMLGVLQGYQYQFPIQSTVRELASNCLDANSEKTMARDILANKIPSSNYYENDNNDPLLVDSKFDESYYDLNWLSEDNKVYIDYYRNANSEKDFITFRDYGVGIGPKRILKYFNLGFSTKRLSKVPIGKFGLGGKAGLSVADFFTMETWYNGMHMKFNVYNSNFESLIPAFDLETGKDNILVIEHPSDPRRNIYALPTTEKNGTLIKIETKKHHWTDYERAVEKQLMFFTEVVFTTHKDDQGSIKKFQPKVLYEDEFLVITDSTYYSRPYLVLNRVNYGSINFDELELKTLTGNLGLKVLPENIDVSPSRESILWKDNTKTQILQRLAQASSSASKVLQANLNQTDFIDWYRTCLYTLSSWYSFRDSGEATVLHTLASIVEAKDLEFRFSADPEVRFNHDPFKMFIGVSVVLVKSEEYRVAGKLKRRLKRESSTINQVVNLPIYLRVGPSSSKKNRYLTTIHGEYAEIKVADLWKDEDTEETGSEEEEKEVLSAAMLELKAKYQEFLSRASKATKLLLESSYLKKYDDVVVGTFDWSEDVEEKEQQTKEEIKAATVSAAERRKQEGKLLLRALRSSTDNYTPEPYQLTPLEIPFDVINKWEDSEIYYGTPTDQQTLIIVAFLCRRDLDWAQKGNNQYLRHIPDPELKNLYGTAYNWELSLLQSFVNPSKGIKLFQVAKDKVKYVRDFKHISKFFAKIVHKTITMSDVLIQWNTARQIVKVLHKLDFLQNLKELFPKQHTAYETLQKYVKTHYRELNIKLDNEKTPFAEAETQLIDHLDKIQQLQLLVHKNSSPEEVAAYVQTNWGQVDIDSGVAVDLDLLQELYQLIDWSSSVEQLLNGNILLTGRSTAYQSYNMYEARSLQPIPHDLFESVVEYCRNKGLL